MEGRAIKGVLFDLDGTLIDTYDLILTSMRYATRKVLGVTIPEGRLMANVGRPLEDQMALFTPDPAKQDLLTKTYRTFCDAMHDECVAAFPGIKEVLERLRTAGLRLGIVTSKRHELAQRGAELTGIAPYMDVLIAPDDWPDRKPAPGGIVHAAELLGLDAGQCAYVGDSPFDIRAGIAAGCMTDAVLWGMFAREILAAEHPTRFCSSPEELIYG